MTAPLRAYLRCDPRDLIEFGLPRALDLIQGEIGADGIVVDALPPPAVVWRAAEGLSPRTVEREAAAQFQPNAARYSLSRIRPPVASWVKSSDPLAQIARACEPRGLALRARVVLCESPPLVARHAHAACIDAYGDSSRARICPVQPDVQAYLGALLEDLSESHPLEALDLLEADFGTAERFHPGRANPAEAGWRGGVLCFCPACRLAAQRAGVDAEALAARIAAAGAASAASDGDALFPDSPEIGRDESGPATDDLLAAYADVRAQAVTDLLAGLRRRCRCEMAVELRDLDAHRGLSAADAAAYVDCWWADANEPPAEALSAALGGRSAIGMVLTAAAHRALPGGAGDLVRPASAGARQGHRMLAFDDFGATPPLRRDWIRQAIRFARREAL